MGGAALAAIQQEAAELEGRAQASHSQFQRDGGHKEEQNSLTFFPQTGGETLVVTISLLQQSSDVMSFWRGMSGIGFKDPALFT